MRGKRRLGVALAVSLLALAAGTGPAAADTTLGSSLADPNEGASFGGSAGITAYQVAAGGETLTAPADGTITSWSVRSSDVGAEYELRIIRPGAGGTFTAAGTSAPQRIVGPGDLVRGPYAVSLPVKAGDMVALDVLAGAGAPINNTVAPAADEMDYFNDPFADGLSASPVIPPPLGSSQELLLQATFRPEAAKGPETGGGGGGTPAPPPVARLSAQDIAGSLRLDASVSASGGSRITGYKVRLDEPAGSSDLECGSGSPVVIPRFSAAARGTATLTVTTADGQSSSTSVPYSGTAMRPLLRRAAKGAHAATNLLLPEVVDYQCLPAQSNPATTGPVTEQNCEMHAGIVHVRGCGLTEVPALCGGVPTPERHIIEAHLIPEKSIRARLGCEGPRVIFARAGARARGSSRASLNQQVSRTQQILASLMDNFYVSTKPVLVNGVLVTPAAGAAVVLAVGGLESTSFIKHYGVYLVSSNSIEGLGGFPLQHGKLDLDVSKLGAAEAPFASFAIKNPVTFGRFTQLAVGAALEQFGGVPSLPITGSFTATFVQGGATVLAFNIALNKLFSNPLDDAPFTGSTTLVTTNEKGLEPATLDINVPDLNLAGVLDLSNLKLHWVGATNEVSGSFGVGVDEAHGAVGGTLAFKGNNFLRGSAFYQADEGGGIQLVGPLFLIGMEEGMTLYQREVPGSATTLFGTADLSVGPAISNKSCGVAQAHGQAELSFYPGPFTLTALNTLELFCIPLRQSYMTANSDGYVEMGGNIQLDVPEVFSVHANLDGQAYLDIKDLSKSHFQIDGSASGTLILPDPIGHVSLSAEAVISDLGAGVCTDVNVLGHDFHPGVTESFRPPPLTGAQFIAQLNLAGDGCSLSPYQPLGKGGAPAITTSRGHRVRRPYSFTAAAGAQDTVVVVHGSGGAPDVTLTGPGGQRIDTTVESASASHLVLRQASTGTTLVEIAGSAAGRWTFAPDPASPPVLGAQIAHTLPPPHLTASVTGGGSQRTLRYAITPQPGLSVSFLEKGTHGGQNLGPARGRSGAIRFVPSQASGTREILAVLTQNGQPRPALVVARFHAAAPRPGRASRIRVSRSRGGLLVSFRPGALARFSVVAVSFAEGRSALVASKPGAGTVLIAEVAAGAKVRKVSITGYRAGLRGPAATLR